MKGVWGFVNFPEDLRELTVLLFNFPKNDAILAGDASFPDGCTHQVGGRNRRFEGEDSAELNAESRAEV
jgi:hypothetical protein